MNLDKTDPSNLDGDFQALLEVQNARKQAGNEQEECVEELLGYGNSGGGPGGDGAAAGEIENIYGSAPASTAHGRGPAGPPTPPPDDGTPDVELLELYTKLCEQVSAGDVTGVKAVCERLRKSNKSLLADELREEETKRTILHKAIEEHIEDVMTYLIQEADVAVLMATYKVTVKDIASEKTCLHQLTHLGDLEHIKLLLKRLSSTKGKMDYLLKTVLSELEGQRPRHLAAIHIAALHGHTDVIQFFVQEGVDVNFKNNKKDTPVLWAARGNHIGTVKALIKMGANLNHQNDKGSTPFYWAVRYGFEEMAQVLIEGKADIHQTRKLGLVSPIVLASALGYTNIVRLLLDNNAKVNMTITNGYTPLHCAAEYGNLNTIILLVQRGAKLDADNDAGDTPLLLAVQTKQMKAVELLARYGADVEDRNKEGKSPWDYAIEDEGEEVLQAYVKCYRIAKKLPPNKLTFSSSKKTPLHIAAKRSDCEKLKALIKMGADVMSRDEGGNTFLHVAARYDITDVLEMFVQDMDVNAQNKDDDTLVHIAARKGNEASVDILLKAKVNLSITNALGETPLHAACKSKDASDDMIGKIVTNLVKTHTWSLVDARDKHGNTALHLAARFDRPEILEKLKDLNPRAGNNEEETPLHVAAKYRRTTVLEMMLEVFRNEIKMQQRKKNGETVLHIAACQGEVEQVRLLINNGADLSIPDNKGNTVLHLLVKESVNDQTNWRTYVNVLHCIVNKATKWWCMRTDLHQPDEESEVYEKHRRDAMIELLTELYNSDGHSALTLAAALGAKEMFEEMLQIPQVFYFPRDEYYEFDVTYLTPKTMPLKKRSMKISQVSSIDLKPHNKFYANTKNENKDISCLDMIVRVRDLQVANEMLDIIPVQQIIKQYWGVYQYMYGLLMFIHIVYMGLLSGYAVPSVEDSLKDEPPERSRREVVGFGFFLSWPVVLFIYEVYYAIKRAVYVFLTFGDRNRQFNSVKEVFNRLARLIIDNIGHISSVAFSSLVFAWYTLYILESENEAYVLSITLVIGWLFTIAFTEGFEAVHSFSIILKNIAVRDMTRFFFLYFFVMLGFAFGLQVLLYLAPTIAEQFPTSWHMFFFVFNMMIGMGDHIFENDYDENYRSNGHTGLPGRLLYLAYITLTTIVLLNLLIAMMTDSYAEVKAREGTTWRVGSLKLALQIERTFGIIPKVFYFVLRNISDRVEYNSDTQRWMLRIKKNKMKLTKVIGQHDVSRALSRINRDMTDLREMYETLEHKLDILLASGGGGSHVGAGGGAGDARRQRKAAVYERPGSAIMKTLKRRETEQKISRHIPE